MPLQRLIQPLVKRLRLLSLWGAFAFAYLLYAGYSVWYWMQPPRGPLLLLPIQLTTTFLFFFAFIWLAPIPWEWEADITRAAFWRNALRSLIFSSAYMLALVWLESLLRQKIGLPPLPKLTYYANTSFQGPALVLVGNLISRFERGRSIQDELRNQAQDAQIRSLQNQMRPHVLFNALNGVAELIHEDPDLAESCVRSMSNLLRRVLDATSMPRHALGQERSLIEDYLALEQMRMEDRLRVSWNWDAALDELSVLPLLVQPLVENAVKHGISPQEEGGELKIIARRDQDHLHLEVHNTGRPISLSIRTGTGIGVKNLRSRLALAYPNNAAFDLRQESEWAIAEIRLNLSSLREAL
jgi:two-component sensor histidine kinase